ncbi:MAG: GGDEF domain-containing protein [Phyllobacterium sp.]
MKFVSPALLLVFSLAFLAVWLIERTKGHLLFLSGSFCLFGVAVLSQLSMLPPDIFGYNTMLSAALYTCGAMAFSEGILRRSGKSQPLWICIGSLALIIGLISYYFYIDRNLVVRVYVLNLGIGCIFLLLTWQVRFLAKGSAIDRSLFWLLLVFSLHFFPRTIMTANSIAGMRQLRTPSEFQAFTDSSFWILVQFSVSVVGVAMGIGLLVITSADVILKLRKERDTDPLTDVLNRRGLENQFRRLAPGKPDEDICFVMCDVDHFKRINDTFGHVAGDIFLAHIAHIIREFARPGDLIARFGGEEFIIVLRNTKVEEAFHLAEQLRLKIEASPIRTSKIEQKITCSFGVAAMDRDGDLWDTINEADEALYAAKTAGRNRTFAKGHRLDPVSLVEAFPALAHPDR